MIHCPRFFALVTLTCCAGVWAQNTDRPYYVGIKQDFTHDSNSLDAPAGSEVADTVSTTSLLGGLNIPFGRQRAYANASLSHQSYKNLTSRNNNGYDLGAGLDWSTVERLSGTVALTSYRHQSPYIIYAAGSTVPLSQSNIERSDDLAARFHLGADTALAFDASLEHRQVGFSASAYAAQEYHMDSASLGVTFRPSGILRLGAGASGQRTKYDNPAVGQATADKSTQSGVYVTGNWVPTGASSVNARLNFSRTKYDIATAANFNGVTGSLAWAWKPTGLLAVTTTLVRDTGQNAGFVQSTNPALQTATNFSRLTDSAQVRADYDLTGKIKMNAVAGYAHRNLVDPVSGAPGSDNTTSLALGANWAALRTLSLGCNVARDSRTATGGGSTPYESNRVGCFGQFTID
jgi:hypothetical protein